MCRIPCKMLDKQWQMVYTHNICHPVWRQSSSRLKSSIPGDVIEPISVCGSLKEGGRAGASEKSLTISILHYFKNNEDRTKARSRERYIPGNVQSLYDRKSEWSLGVFDKNLRQRMQVRGTDGVSQRPAPECHLSQGGVGTWSWRLKKATEGDSILFFNLVRYRWKSYEACDWGI